MEKLIYEADGPTRFYVNAAVIRCSFFMKSVLPEKENFMSWQFRGCLGREELHLSELIQGSGTPVAQLGLCTLQVVVISSCTLRAVKSQETSVVRMCKNSSYLLCFS